MKKPCFLERIRICGSGETPAKHALLFSGQGNLSSPCWGRGIRGKGA
jgi:hypothetical protein